MHRYGVYVDQCAGRNLIAAGDVQVDESRRKLARSHEVETVVREVEAVRDAQVLKVLALPVTRT